MPSTEPDTFLSELGLNTLRDLPDIEALEDADSLSKEKLGEGISTWVLRVNPTKANPNVSRQVSGRRNNLPHLVASTR